MSWTDILKREESSSPSVRSPGALSPINSNGSSNGNSGGWTRLQTTFEAIKKMSAGMGSPRFDHSPGKEKGEGERSPGYFDVTTEEGQS